VGINRPGGTLLLINTTSSQSHVISERSPATLSGLNSLGVDEIICVETERHGLTSVESVKYINVGATGHAEMELARSEGGCGIQSTSIVHGKIMVLDSCLQLTCCVRDGEGVRRGVTVDFQKGFGEFRPELQLVRRGNDKRIRCFGLDGERACIYAVDSETM